MPNKKYFICSILIFIYYLFRHRKINTEIEKYHYEFKNFFGPLLQLWHVIIKSRYKNLYCIFYIT